VYAAAADAPRPTREQRSAKRAARLVMTTYEL
jgi:hypothetical protein